jgi:dienelactone hydrolase
VNGRAELLVSGECRRRSLKKKYRMENRVGRRQVLAGVGAALSANVLGLRARSDFRPDWEKVITPVVDYALSRGDVDPKRIAIQGISQGGYWVPRAVAFEKRIAAAIADPGVIDVSTAWTATLPKPMLQLLQPGRSSMVT